MENNFQWTDELVSEFLKGVKTGIIQPKSCGHTEDNTGPLTTFSFPNYFCEIHVHWKDINREEMSVAHIKDLRTNRRITSVVDTYTISMLRHFSGLDEKRKKYGGNEKSINPKKRTFKSKPLVYVLSIFIIFIVISLVLNRNTNTNTSKSTTTKFDEYYATTSNHGATLYETSHEAYLTWVSNKGFPIIGRSEAGLKVKVIDFSKPDASYKIETGDGKIGWVFQDDLLATK